MLVFDARHRVRDFDAAFRVDDGETVAVLGPNGAGKSTLINLVAGLLRADEGRATLDGEELFDVATRSRFLPAHRRGIALLAQDALLFPHLTVLDNVAFGPRSSGLPARAARDRADHWLGEVDASHLADRKPGQLSGGQAQRVAVARALAAEPKLLLMDEPMAALDASTAPTMRRMLRRVLDGRTAIIVTHDLLDAYALADRVIIVEDGRIVESGPTRVVVERPRTAFVAELAGLNLIVGAATGRASVVSRGVELFGREVETLREGQRAAAAVRPTSARVSARRSPDGAVNEVVGVVKDLERRGDFVRIRTDLFAADVVPASVAELDIAIGSELWFSFEAEDIAIYGLEPEPEPEPEPEGDGARPV